MGGVNWKRRYEAELAKWAADKPKFSFFVRVGVCPRTVWKRTNAVWVGVKPNLLIQFPERRGVFETICEITKTKCRLWQAQSNSFTDYRGCTLALGCKRVLVGLWNLKPNINQLWLIDLCKSTNLKVQACAPTSLLTYLRLTVQPP